MMTRSELLVLVRNLPERPGVYQYFDDTDTIIYVGKAKNLRRRVSSYFREDKRALNLKTRCLVGEIRNLKYLVTNSEQDAFLLENNLIKQYQPKYNILLKDGKSYPKVVITKEPYPRILKVRNLGNIPKKWEIYGPFTFGYALDMLLKVIAQLYPIRTCPQLLDPTKVSEGKYKVCLKYHLKKCCGICEAKVSQDEYMHYIDDARRLIKGDGQELLQSLRDEMKHYSALMQYEQAAGVLRKIQVLEKFCSKNVVCENTVPDSDVFGYTTSESTAYIALLKVHNGSVVAGQVIEYKKRLDDESDSDILSHGILELRTLLSSNNRDLIVPFLPDIVDDTWRVKVPVVGDKKRLLDIAQKTVEEYRSEAERIADKMNPDNKTVRTLTKLQTLLGLAKIPDYIESFDISNILGTNSTGCCIVYRHGRKSPNDYMRFNIKTVSGIDDYGSTQEVVVRRYQHLLEAGEPLPDLIIADGGIGHKHAIEEVLRDVVHVDIPVLGLKKDRHHKTNKLLWGVDSSEVDININDEVFHLLAQIQDEVHRYTIRFHREKRSKSQTISILDNIRGIGPTTKKVLLEKYKSVARITTTSQPDLVALLGPHKGNIVYNALHHDI